MTSRTLRLSDGASVRVIEAGTGSPVLLIHGVGMRAEAWGPQMAPLAAAHRVIAVDMPGHGESDPLPATARLPEFVAWAARVIDALGLGPVAVAGHSMGALVAGGLAVEHPERVSRVALLNAVYRRSDAARDAVLARAEDIAAGKIDPEAPLARWFTDADAAIRDQVAGWLRGVNLQGYATAYRAFAEGDSTYADRFGTVRCPALILTADGDANSTPDMTQAIAAAMPNAQPLVIYGHRHMLNLTAPDDVTKALLDWLEETQQ